jgi:hypothetical protein
MMRGIDGGKIGPMMADGAGHRGRECAGEALRSHGIDLDAADPADVGQRGPGHAGEDETAEDVDLGESARQSP